MNVLKVFLSDFALNSVREAAFSKWNHTHDISDSVRSISKSLTGITAAVVHTGFFFGGVNLISVGWIGINKMKLLPRKSDDVSNKDTVDLSFWAPNIFLCALGGYISMTSWVSASKLLHQYSK